MNYSKNRYFRFFNYVTLFLFTTLFVSCEKNIPSVTKPALGTVCTITLFDEGREDVYNQIFDRLNEIEQHLSVNISTSDIAQINQKAGIEPVKVHADTLSILSTALHFAYKTEGALNPAIGSLVSLWGIGGDNPRLPTEKEIEEQKALTDYKQIVIDTEKSTVYLPVKGMKLDTGGITKGYAADEVVRLMNENKIAGGLVDLGGNVYAVGTKADGSKWRVGVKNPFDSTGTPLIRIDVENATIVTSGVYERFFIQDGIRFHHLLDSKTGYPVNNGLQSVTIITSSSMVADALSTAVFVLGKEKGISFLEEIGIPGFCVTDDKKIKATKGLETSIALLIDGFEFE